MPYKNHEDELANKRAAYKRRIDSMTDEEHKAFNVKRKKARAKWVAKQRAKDPEGYKKRCVDYQRKYKKLNHEKVRVLNNKAYRKRYKTTKTRAKQLCTSAAGRAATHGIAFDLKWQDIEAKLIAGKCEATGLPFDLEPYESARMNPYAPSIDQIIPGGGYTKGNTRVVILAFNRAKSEWDDQLVRTVAQAIVDNVPALRLVGVAQT